MEQWVVCSDALTTLNSYALWERIDKISADADHIMLNRAQRFTASALEEWRILLDAAFGIGATA